MKRKRLKEAGFLLGVAWVATLSGACDSEMVPAELESVPTRVSVAGSAALTEAPDPSSKTYVRYHEERSGKSERLNHNDHPNGARDIVVSAIDLTLDDADDVDILKRFNTDEDVRSLSIYADRLVVKTLVRVPGAVLRIHARELVFEDTGGRVSRFDLTPASIRTRATDEAAHGIDGSTAHVYVQTVREPSGERTRFVLDGGKGQDGSPGSHGDDGDSRTMLRDTHPHIIEWAERYGVVGLPVFIEGRTLPPSLILSELRNNALSFGQSAPTDGKDATPGGVPGNASSGGSLHTNHGRLGRAASFAPGAPGKDAGFYRGGNAGEPIRSMRDFKVNLWDVQECDNRPFFPRCETRKRLVVHGTAITTFTSFGKGVRSPKASIRQGQEGRTHLRIGNSVWLHPSAVAMTIDFAEDAFLNGYEQLARTTLEDAIGSLERHPKAASAAFGLSERDALTLAQQEQEVRSLLTKLETGVDFFGNPKRWVPALSLEANQIAFAQESEWAIKTLYVANWLLDANLDAENQAVAFDEAKRVLREEIVALEDEFNEAIDRVPALERSASEISGEIDLLQDRLEFEEQRLMDQAVDNVRDRHKVPFWRKGLKVIGGLAKVFPVGQPITGGVGTLLGAISEFDADKPWDSIGAIPEVLGAFAKEGKASEKAEELKGKKEETKISDKDEEKSIKEKLAEVQKFTKPLIDELKKHKDLLKPAKAPEDEVAAELEKLKKEDPVFVEFAAEAESLLAEKKRVTDELTDILEVLENNAIEINAKYLAIADLAEGLSDAATVTLSRRAVETLEQMKEDAVRRLLKYQYGLAKAFEYRTLRPYEGDFSLLRLFEQMAVLASSTDSDGRLDAAQYQALFAIYRNELSAIVEDIYDDYNANHTAQTTSVRYSLTDSEVEELNAGGIVSVNFWDKGLFRDEHQDARIVGLRVVDIDAEQVGSASSFGYLDIDMEHAGLSRVWRNGQVHLFQHNSGRSEPMRWSTRLERAGNVVHSQLSASSQSLLRSLLTDADADIMLFSRPSAWGDIRITKAVASDGDLDFDIRAVTVELTYDFSFSRVAPWSSFRDEQNAVVDRVFVRTLGRPADEDELARGRLKLDLGGADDDVEAFVRKTYRQEILERQVAEIYERLFQRDATDDELGWGAAELADGRKPNQLERYARRITEAVFAETGDLPTFDDLVEYTELFDAEGLPAPGRPTKPLPQPCGFAGCDASL